MVSKRDEGGMGKESVVDQKLDMNIFLLFVNIVYLRAFR